MSVPEPQGRTPAKLLANRRNALRSTGPRTPAGKMKSACNALATGLYVQLAVVPALGETTEGWEQFSAAVAADLGAVGQVELTLAEQIASLFWRLRRVRAAESVAFVPATGDLPPDPDTITGEGVSHHHPLPPGSPPALRLAHARAAVRSVRKTLAGVAATVHVLTEPDAGDGGVSIAELESALSAVVGPRGEEWVIDAAARNLGLDPEEVEWTAGLVSRGLATLAVAQSRDPVEFTAAVVARLRERADWLEGRLAEVEAEEVALVDRMKMDRARAAAAAALADEGLLARAAKIASHLGRELERMLGILDRVRAARSDGPDPVPAVGFVPSKRVSDGRGIDPRVLPLRAGGE